MRSEGLITKYPYASILEKELRVLMKFRHPGVRLRSIYKENILNFEGSNNYKGRSIKSLLMRFLKKDYPRLKMISEFSELSLNSEKRSFSNF